MKKQRAGYLTVSLVAAILMVGALILPTTSSAVAYDNSVMYNYPIFHDYFPPKMGISQEYVAYRPIDYVVHYPNTWNLVYPQVVPYTLIGAQNAYHATRRQYDYTDPQEYYGSRRAPRIQGYPPYRALGPEAKPMGLAKVDLGWTSDGSLRVTWGQRTQPVRSVELALIDQSGRELSRQTITEMPLQTALAIPEGASDLRVTVNYEDGGVSSSATSLPK